jgi:hypothetical protein
MNLRKIAAAAGFATGAALTFAPLASADTSSDWLSSIDSLLTGGALPAASALDYQISFNGVDLLPTTDNSATATTLPGQFGLAIASGDGAKAIAEGGTGDTAMASGTNALAEAGSTTAGATNFNFDSATDIGTNADPSTYTGAPDGAYAGGGSLIGGVDSGTGSSNDTAFDIGNDTGTNTTSGDFDGGNSGAFAGDSALIGDGATAGSGDTAYTSGNISGFGDGSAAVAGSNDSAYTTGTETGQNEGAFSGFGANNSATADANYSSDDTGVSATDGNGNYALAYGPANSGASAGGENTTTLAGNNNIAIVNDPFGTTADNAAAGSSPTAAGSNDLAEVLYTHGDASAQGANSLVDIITPFGTTATPAAATAAADPAATDITSTVNSEIASLNALFASDVALAGDPATDVITNGANTFDTTTLAVAPDTGTPNLLDYELYGLNPIANASSDPGAYDVFNGALTEFSDAYNVEAFSLLNPGVDINTIPLDDLFGTSTNITAALASDTVSGAVTAFLTDGWNDLLGYF